MELGKKYDFTDCLKLCLIAFVISAWALNKLSLLSLFNAHALIMFVQLYLNLNQLCLNQRALGSGGFWTKGASFSASSVESDIEERNRKNEVERKFPLWAYQFRNRYFVLTILTPTRRESPCMPRVHSECPALVHNPQLPITSVLYWTNSFFFSVLPLRPRCLMRSRRQKRRFRSWLRLAPITFMSDEQ